MKTGFSKRFIYSDWGVNWPEKCVLSSNKPAAEANTHRESMGIEHVAHNATMKELGKTDLE